MLPVAASAAKETTTVVQVEQSQRISVTSLEDLTSTSSLTTPQHQENCDKTVPIYSKPSKQAKPPREKVSTKGNVTTDGKARKDEKQEDIKKDIKTTDESVAKETCDADLASKKSDDARHSKATDSDLEALQKVNLSI